MKKGLEYDDMIGCAEVVSVSALYNRYSNLAFFSYSMTHFSYRLYLVSS